MIESSQLSTYRLNQSSGVNASGTWHSFTYDNNGNLTVAGAYLNPNAHDYIYDAENRLIEIRQGTTQIAEYSYDDLDRRISKYVVSTGITTTYVYDGFQVIAEYEDDSINPEYLARKFIYGPGLDEPIAMIDIDGETETWYFYHYEGLGSVTALSKLNGSTVQIIERYQYTIFGQTTVTLDGNTGNPYRYTGRRWDDESSLYYYRARMYSAKLGRFLQTDPIGYLDGMNLYQYCGNDPANYIDPWGLESKEGAIATFVGWLLREAAEEAAEETIEEGVKKALRRVNDMLYSRDTDSSSAGEAIQAFVNCSDKKAVRKFQRETRQRIQREGRELSRKEANKFKLAPHDKKHHMNANYINGKPVGKPPTNANRALYNSVRFTRDNSHRVGVDPKSGEYVMFHGSGKKLHGYKVTWQQLTQRQKNALVNLGYVKDQGGKIIIQ